ncbi:Hypothetical_protein [Hexamita inflata]|uniref:Hypothetical_protein n=1 Tax=Hexamita inflata TaxID=28002 RepID=A0AA86UN52_9EUKA|nr:Hypothetical protein HINF_LOCUS45662 [Hexamita inflata]
MFALQKTALFIPLLHRWRQPTPAERACSNTDAGEKGKGKYAVLPSDQRCRPAGFGFCQAETRSSGSWREVQVVQGKAKQIGLLEMNAHVPKTGGSRPVSETIFDEKTSEISFQALQPDRQCRYIHQSWQSRARQLAFVAAGVFDFRSRNPAAESDKNNDILFEIGEVDLELVSPIPRGPVCYSQRRPSRKRRAMRRSLGIVVRFPFLKKIQKCLHYRKQRFPFHFSIDGDNRRQQKEPAAAPPRVRKERESTPCFRRTSAVDPRVLVSVKRRLGAQAVGAKHK